MMHHPPKFNKNSPYWISLDEKSTSKLTSELVNKDILAIICGTYTLTKLILAWNTCNYFKWIIFTIDLSIKTK